MFSMLGELFSLLIPALKVGLKILLLTPLILTMMALIKNLLLMVGGVLKNNLIGEIMLFVQIWAPFNIVEVLNWVILFGTSVLFYYAYKWLVANTNIMIKD